MSHLKESNADRQTDRQTSDCLFLSVSLLVRLFMSIASPSCFPSIAVLYRYPWERKHLKRQGKRIANLFA